MPEGLTIVILTKNEEHNIAGVIGNARLLTEKIIVVDSGSTDRTVALAGEMGAQVVFRAWDNDFAAQRNFALQYVTTEWVLYVDADERLNEELCAAVRQVTCAAGTACYSMARRNRAFGFTYKHGVFGPDTVIRLFPARQVHWQNKVHEKAICNLPLRRLSGYMEHYTYASLRQWWDKCGRYTDLWADDRHQKGQSVSRLGVLAHTCFGFLKVYVVQGGCLDGWGGIYSSGLHCIYTFMKYLKLYELQRRAQ